ncbi:hypothetical protein BAY59_10810 [Prauserella coralliicola]|nr:hypothetical protein BAY59_10810 [Prauserella coralliicola]
MTLELQRESTEFIFFGVTGDVPSVGADVAFLAAGVRPTPSDWKSAIVVPDSQHELWSDAVGSGAAGSYFVAILIGAHNGGTLVLDPGDYQAWARLTDTIEQPVRILPQAVSVL